MGGIEVENSVRPSHPRQGLPARLRGLGYPETVCLHLDVQHAGAIKMKMVTWCRKPARVRIAPARLIYQYARPFY